MNIKANLGICKEIEGADKLVIIPKDSEMFKINEFVVIISAEDFMGFTEDVNGIIKFMESAKQIEDEK